MDIKIFHSYRGEDNFIINWQTPDYFFNWFIKNFSYGKLDYEKKKFDVANPAFSQLLNLLDSKPDIFSISRFFKVEIDIITEWDVENFFWNLSKDINRLFKRKMINLEIDKTNNKETDIKTKIPNQRRYRNRAGISYCGKYPEWTNCAYWETQH